MSEKEEKIIKCKSRVQKHGEVLTPRKIVRMMLDVDGIKEKSEDIFATFLEPSAGEGAFLVEILKRKLKTVSENYNASITQYENYALLALSTLYGVELLNDNTKKCVLNMHEVFLSYYAEACERHQKKEKYAVKKCANLIISKNIVQGDFLKKTRASGEPIVFSEWKPVISPRARTAVQVQRTEYTLDEIIQAKEKESDSTTRANALYQPLLFAEEDLESTFQDESEELVYELVDIQHIYKEKMEVAEGVTTDD